MLRIRRSAVETVQVDGKDVVRPKLDEAGQEIELYSIEIPADVEVEGGAAIEAYVAEQLAAQEARASSPPEE